jgi:hypothetical protein
MINCPFHIGQCVTVAPTAKYANEWPGEYLIVGLSWDYRDRPEEVNIAIASKDDIAKRYGSTDGWSIDDLLPARS